MKPLKKLYLLFLAMVLCGSLSAQEFNCMISVSSQKIGGSDTRTFETMQAALYEFMNNRKWSNFNFTYEERIEASLLLTINDRLGSDEYKATLNVVLRRPVFNTAYNTNLLNHIDKEFQFRYSEYQPLDFSDGTHSSNLTSVFAYYAYMMLGLYFDSFSAYGGSVYFEKAQTVVNSAQSAPESGWKAYESTHNRFWFVENIQNSANSALRDFLYKYNRMGLDIMYDKVDQGRSAITESLNLLQQTYNAKPDLFLLQLVLDSKRDEIVNIYSDQKVPPIDKTNVFNLLKEIDPGNGSKYQAILESK